MRIISGKARGTKLQTVEGLGTRPTTDRVKESLFNLLQYEFWDKQVLDLFAGSGALGLEAFSRGASKVTFVDNNRQCVDMIQKNIEKVKATSETVVLQQEVVSAVRRQGSKTIDFAFMDPPYHQNLIVPVLEALIDSDVLKEGALVCVEHEKTDIWEVPVGFECWKQRTYGITTLTILRRLP